jgi:O-antigen/teichoic acid export membrane protein
LIAVVCGPTFAISEALLRIVYGVTSPYLPASSEVRVLVVGALFSCATELICSFFHGVDRPRAAFLTNAAGGASAALLAVPTIWLWGVWGACWVLAITSAIRLATCSLLLSKMIADDLE